MKKKISVKEIKAIANGEANIKDLFPEVFETVLEVGKVYKSDSFIGKITCIDINDEFLRFHYYGFNSRGFEKFSFDLHENEYHKFIEATKEEWEEALIKEAGRRGFKKGTWFKSRSGQKFIFKDFWFSTNVPDNIWNGNCGIIFENGTWAEIIETITKEEAEKLLNKKIV